MDHLLILRHPEMDVIKSCMHEADLVVGAVLLLDAGLGSGLNICNGQVTHEHLAEDLGLPYVKAQQALAKI